VTKKFAGKGCRGWKMAGVLLTVARGDGGRLSDQRGVGTVGRRGPLRRDDRAGLVCYTDSSANLRIFLLTS
jgi:hypothetical protein